MKIKLLLLFILFFTVIHMNAQETIYLKSLDDTTVVNKKDASYYKVIDKDSNSFVVNNFTIKGKKISTEHYLDSTLLIFNGEYTSYFQNGNINMKGNYKLGNMEGWWISYNEDGNYIQAKQFFKENLRHGKCFTLYQNGKPKSLDIYVRDTLVTSTCYDSLGHTIECNTSIASIYTYDSAGIYERSEVMPIFPGGSEGLSEFILSNLKYPRDAFEKGLQGKVLVKFYIDLDGTVKEPIIVNDGIGSGCAEEALRICNIMPKWNPGLQKSKPVKVYINLPITFKIGL